MISEDGHDDPLGPALDRGDLDELVRLVDRLCATREWALLSELGDRCRRAVERGRQLWPAADLASYRLALEAPGPYAGPTVVEGAARFTLGPLAEVAASTHTWGELCDHIPSPTAAAIVAHERVVRGEDLAGHAGIDRRVLEIPLALQAWEPAYPVAAYGADEADFPAPHLPRAREEVDAPHGTVIADPDALAALRGLVRPWAEESNGRVEAVAVEGDSAAAIRALGAPRVRLAELTTGDALATVAWAGASGGAHGRRRGAAMGRFEAWWLITALGGALDDFPLPADEVGSLAHELRWHVWDAGEPEIGWSLRLAVEDPTHGLAWAIAATDAE